MPPYLASQIANVVADVLRRAALVTSTQGTSEEFARKVTAKKRGLGVDAPRAQSGSMRALTTERTLQTPEGLRRFLPDTGRVSRSAVAVGGEPPQPPKSSDSWSLRRGGGVDPGAAARGSVRDLVGAVTGRSLPPVPVPRHPAQVLGAACVRRDHLAELPGTRGPPSRCSILHPARG